MILARVFGASFLCVCHGLNPDCRVCGSKIHFKNALRITTVTESDIEAAHMIPGSLRFTDSLRKRPIMMVRFIRKDSRDVIIRNRKILNISMKHTCNSGRSD